MFGQQAESWLFPFNPSWQTSAEKEPAENRLKEKSCCVFFPTWFQCWFGLSAFPRLKCHFPSQPHPRPNPFPSRTALTLHDPPLPPPFVAHPLLTLPLLVLLRVLPSAPAPHWVFPALLYPWSSHAKHPGLSCCCCFVFSTIPCPAAPSPALVLSPPAPQLTRFPSAHCPPCSHYPHSASQAELSLSPLAFLCLLPH